MSFGAGLIYCVIVDKGESPAVVISAEDLAKEFSANPEETSKKYDKKHLILTGEVTDREFNSAGAAAVILKGHDKIPVKCHFSAFEKGVAKSMKVGNKVKLVGEYTLNFGNDDVNLYLCMPIGK
jgi:hypothetical protein